MTVAGAARRGQTRRPRRIVLPVRRWFNRLLKKRQTLQLRNPPWHGSEVLVIRLTELAPQRGFLVEDNE